jgi:hypothetical protein
MKTKLDSKRKITMKEGLKDEGDKGKKKRGNNDREKRERKRGRDEGENIKEKQHPIGRKMGEY